MTVDQFKQENPLDDWLRARGVVLVGAGRELTTNVCAVKEHKNGHLCVSVDLENGVWHCNDCDTGGDIIRWMALEEGKSDGAILNGLQLDDGKKVKAKEVAAYDYVDEEGRLLFQCVRYVPKDFRQRRPDATAIGGWVYNLKGVRRVLFRLPQVLAAKKKGVPILLVEGEKDVLALVEHGFEATCNPMGAKKWDEGYTATLEGADVILIPDKDADGRAHRDLVASRLTGHVRSLKVVECPNLNGSVIKDAADFFEHGGEPSDLDALAEAAPLYSPGQAASASEETGLPAIVNAAIIVADTSIHLPPQVIVGLLHQGLKAVLGSGSKSYKSWILIDLAISVANGLPFWKFDTVKGRVLYINFEIPLAFMRDRIIKVAEAKGVKDLSNLDVWNLRGRAESFTKLIGPMLKHIGVGKYSLVIVDPIYKGLGGRDENSAGDIAQLCNELEQIPVVSGAALIFGAHYSKGNQSGKDAIDRIGGSGVWGRDADSIITLTRHEEEHAYAAEFILRNHPPMPSFVVKWDYPLYHIHEELDPTELKQIGGRRPEKTPDDLMALMRETGLTNMEWQEAAAAAKISTRNYYRFRAELESENRVFDSKVSGKWVPVIEKEKGPA
jgi:hypothetical protein